MSCPFKIDPADELKFLWGKELEMGRKRYSSEQIISML
jgi:hypothetical protein